MAGTSTKNVVVGKPNLSLSGGVFVAPMGTTRPKSFDDPYDPAYKSVGYIADDGVTESNDRSADDIKAWGSDIVASPQTDYGIKIQFTMIESGNAEASKLAFGADNVTEEDGEIVIRRNSKSLPQVQVIVDLLDGENSSHLDIGVAKVTEVGDITYADGDVVGYDVTLTCYPDEDGDTVIGRTKRASSGGDSGE